MPNPEHRSPDRPGGDDPGRGRRLGIDVGSVRIGVAVSDPDGILATPVETVRRDKTDRHLRRLSRLADELEAVEVIVGLPVRFRTEPVRQRRTPSTSRRIWRDASRRRRCGWLTNG